MYWVLRDSKIIFLPWNQTVLLRTRERKKHEQGMGEGNCLGCCEEKQVGGDVQGTAVKIFERRHFGLSHCFGVGACQRCFPPPAPKVTVEKEDCEGIGGFGLCGCVWSTWRNCSACPLPRRMCCPSRFICHYLPGVMAPLCSAHNADNVACFPEWEICWKWRQLARLLFSFGCWICLLNTVILPLCPNRQMLSGCVCWNVVRLNIRGGWCRLLVQHRSKLGHIGSINFNKSCSILAIQSD